MVRSATGSNGIASAARAAYSEGAIRRIAVAKADDTGRFAGTPRQLARHVGQRGSRRRASPAQRRQNECPQGPVKGSKSNSTHMEHSNSSKFSAGRDDERRSMVVAVVAQLAATDSFPNASTLRSRVIDVIENASKKPRLVAGVRVRGSQN